MISYTQKHRKITIIIVCIVLTLLVGSLVYVYKFNGNILGWKPSQNTQQENNKYSPTTPEQKKAGIDTKKNSLNSQNSSKTSTSNDAPLPPTTVESGKDKVELIITAENQSDTSYQVRTQIGYVTNDGSCTLTLKKDSTLVTKTAAVYPLAKTSTCQGFDIPITELSAGTWQMDITFSNSTLIGSISKSVIIK